MKHARAIVLQPWQRAPVEKHPRQFVRALIQTDGCRVTNKVTIRGKSYTYPRYFFSNESRDIIGLFPDACDQFAIEWRMNRPNSVSIARKHSVEALDRFVGPKR